MDRATAIFPELGGSKKWVHFVGIGGIGMSALARFFMANKWLVSGSDLVKSSITAGLAKEGARVKIGHKKGHINGHVGLVIHSKAAKSDNPELREAKRLGIPCVTYSEAVGRLTRNYKTVAVAGAHGKSTTTALTSLVLQKAGLDPTVIIGTTLHEFGNRNFRAGRDPSTSLRAGWLALEADEFGKSFLDYSPAVAVVTNIDLEHLDTYKNLADIKNNFFKFLSNTNRGGTLVLNKDSKSLRSLAPRIKKLAKQKNLKIVWFSIRNSQHSHALADLHHVLKIPGEHNISNAVAAYKVGCALAIPHNKIISAIGSFRGSWRRMEYKGRCQMSDVRCQMLIYDDYAHHPTEIKATLRAFKEKYPKSPIFCVYQPHQALRLKKLWRGFVDSFADADVLITIPMYQVAGRDPSTRSGRARFNSKSLAAAIKRKYPTRAVFYLPHPKNIESFVSKIIHSYYSQHSHEFVDWHYVLVMMGAGNIADYTHLLLKR
ncbi:MAG: UDP-N-acetylmuramate--L-alanine ligase [Patescibacteria group bacterium]